VVIGSTPLRWARGTSVYAEVILSICGGHGDHQHTCLSVPYSIECCLVLYRVISYSIDSSDA
jgi:hypothetical protein